MSARGTPTPTHAEITELLGAWALDAVDDGEAVTVEEHLATCPRCRLEVAEHREVAARLAFVGEPAPPGLWDRIAASLEETPPPLDMSRIVTIQSAPAALRRRSVRLRTAAIVAAAAAIVIALLGVEVQRLDSRTKRLDAALRGRQDLARIATEPGTTAVTLRSADGAVTIKAFLAAAGESVMDAHDLPALPNGEEYQLWGTRAGEQISLRLLGARPGVVEFRAPPNVATLVVTAEAQGGVAAPHGPAVVTS